MTITTTSASSPIPVAKNEEQRHPDNQKESHKSDQRPHALRPLPPAASCHHGGCVSLPLLERLASSATAWLYGGVRMGGGTYGEVDHE